jgi:uncharacterized phage protein (TIGR01671 family)
MSNPINDYLDGVFKHPPMKGTRPMREIRFRAWDYPESKMVYPPSPVSSAASLEMTLDGRIYIDGQLQNLELMQYTGLKDKNGVEIYEGDIIRIGLDDENCIVEYLRDRFIGTWSKNGFETDLWQLVKDNGVIGNIYESPELLEATDGK